MRLLLLAAVLLAGAAHADDLFDNPACKPLAALQPPAADQPKAAELAGLDGCDSETRYYVAEGKPDYAAVRRCAYAERAKGDELQFGGAGMLMMLYANGQGVARNARLAKKFACEYAGAPAELEGRLSHIDALAAESDTTPLDICDDITSGYMMGFCASREAGAAKAQRDSRHAALTKNWSEADRAAFATLRKAADTYFDAVVEGEVDMSGTARGALAVGARESLENGLADALAKFDQGQLPRGTAEGFAAADKALNTAYAAAMKAARPVEGEDFSNLGSVRPDGIRAAERAWIKYRDAWVVFGAHKYPAAGADAWRTWLTRERTQALKELSGE